MKKQNEKKISWTAEIPAELSEMADRFGYNRKAVMMIALENFVALMSPKKDLATRVAELEKKVEALQGQKGPELWG